MYLQIPSPVGYPVVLYKEDSVYGWALRGFIIENGFADNYSWDYHSNSNDSSNSIKNSDSLILEMIISICVTIAIIIWIISYRMRYNSLTRNKYEKISISEILSPLSDRDGDRDEEDYSLN